MISSNSAGRKKSKAGEAVQGFKILVSSMVGAPHSIIYVDISPFGIVFVLQDFLFFFSMSQVTSLIKRMLRTPDILC